MQEAMKVSHTPGHSIPQWIYRMFLSWFNRIYIGKGGPKWITPQWRPSLKSKNDLPDRKCPNRDNLSPTSDESWYYKRGRGNRWKTKHLFDLRVQKCFPVTSPGCVIISWSHGRQDKSNYILRNVSAQFNSVSELSFEYLIQWDLKKKNLCKILMKPAIWQIKIACLCIHSDKCWCMKMTYQKSQR